MAELISIYSRCVVQLNALSAAKKTLVTNYNVLTERHPYRDKILGKAVPDFLEVSHRVETVAEMPTISKFEHSLYDENHDPLYFSLSLGDRRLPVEARRGRKKVTRPFSAPKH